MDTNFWQTVGISGGVVALFATVLIWFVKKMVTALIDNNNRNAESLEKMVDALNGLGEKASAGHNIVMTKLDLLGKDVIGIKSNVTETNEHLISKWNEMATEWKDTRNVIRNCEKIK